MAFAQAVRGRGLSGFAEPTLEWTPARAAQALSRWRTLLALGPPEKRGLRSVISSQGDVPREVFLVARGIVKLVVELPCGEEVFLTLRRPGQFIDYSSLDSGIAHPFSGITIVASEIHRISLDLLRAAQRGNPDVGRRQASLDREDLHDLAARHLRFQLRSPAQRLESVLWELAAVIGESDSGGRTRLVLPLDNSEMASLCGVSESYYKTIRRELEQAGRVSHEGQCRWILSAAGAPGGVGTQ